MEVSLWFHESGFDLPNLAIRFSSFCFGYYKMWLFDLICPDLIRILVRVANITDFSVEVRNSENDPYFSKFLYGVLTFSDFLWILQFFDFFQHIFFEYKYMWRDRNISFSKMRGRYDRACCLDNLNHKKVIIHGYRWAFVSDRIAYLHSPIAACDYQLDRIQSNFIKMKQEPQGYNLTSDKLEFVRNTMKIMWRFSQENLDNFSMISWLCFAEKFYDFCRKS